MRQPLICPASAPLLETVSKQLEDSRRRWGLSVQRAPLNCQFNSRASGGVRPARRSVCFAATATQTPLDSARRPSPATGSLPSRAPPRRPRNENTTTWPEAVASLSSTQWQAVPRSWGRVASRVGPPTAVARWLIVSRAVASPPMEAGGGTPPSRWLSQLDPTEGRGGTRRGGATPAGAGPGWPGRG